jgi:hypothetical protein
MTGTAVPSAARMLRSAPLKTFVSFIVVAVLMSGCVAGGSISHVDSQGATKPDAGPELCKDGSTPPCNDRG